MAKVLVVAFDGLQPTQVTPAAMPHLARFAAEGVAFRNHHSVYPTMTRVNVASLVTGRLSGAHGIAGNRMVARDGDPGRVMDVLEPDLARLAGAGQRVLLCPTLADRLAEVGREYVAVGVGSSGNAYVHHPRAGAAAGATIHTDFCLPRGLHAELAERFGAWPAKERPNTAVMAHAVRIMTEYVLAERDPAVAFVWLSEPDNAQHAQGVGSALAREAISAADDQFGRLLTWLEESGRGSETDVLAVSDHGYATVAGVVDVEAELRAAGFAPLGEPGGVGVASNGGTVLLYVTDGDGGTAERVADWVTRRPWCGPLLAAGSASGVAGTLPATLAGAAGPRAPELAVSFAWDSEVNEAGYAGRIYSSSGRPGVGQHGSMSRHEVRSVLFARGPSFKRRCAIDAPTGNGDVAPTLLHVLGVPANDAMDGRVLGEGLAGGPAPQDVGWSTEAFEARRGDYRQRVVVSRVGPATYVDEGSASVAGAISPFPPG